MPGSPPPYKQNPYGSSCFSYQSRLEAVERERAAALDDLNARERDVASLLEQKRALEGEVSRAQRALSRGALETASMAQGELALQVWRRDRFYS